MDNDGATVRLVKDELHRHPDVGATAIAVASRAGRVTLRGTVGSVDEKRDAGKAAQNASGVVAVANELEIAALNARGREDAELRARVLEALMLDPNVPGSIDVEVADRFVTLAGTAKWQYQRDAAEAVAGSIVGPRNLANQIELVQPSSLDASELKKSIVAALGSDEVRVTTSAGQVTLTGSVRSWSRHDAAIAAARATPGVAELEDRITVTP